MDFLGIGGTDLCPGQHGATQSGYLSRRSVNTKGRDEDIPALKQLNYDADSSFSCPADIKLGKTDKSIDSFLCERFKKTSSLEETPKYVHTELSSHSLQHYISSILQHKCIFQHIICTFRLYATGRLQKLKPSCFEPLYSCSPVSIRPGSPA